MRPVSAIAILACLIPASTAAAPKAAELPTKPMLTLAATLRIIAAAEKAAELAGAPCVVAVVDDGGWLIAQQRMDRAPMLASVELAPAKARTAAMFRKPSQALEEAINHGRLAATTAPFVQMQGGVPLIVGGQVVGAIGISADTPQHDQQIAEAGARALGP